MTSLPNIMITGTPGTGKTTLSLEIAKLLDYTHVNLSEIAKNENLCEDYDPVLCSYIIDDIKALNYLRKIIKTKKIVLDYHECEFLDPNWFSHVIVLRSDVKNLHERYTKRNYGKLKITQNIEAEIFQLILDDAIECFGME
ncbi:hypothetical protein MXB_640, partial [Myxobolus squamalis]